MPFQILIVDDDPLVRNALCLMIEAFGHDAVGAASTEEALGRIGDGFRPDLVLADYRLRTHDTGVKAVQAVRQMLGKAVPAIILTGDTSPERLAEVLRSGLHVLHKPVSGRDLIGRIDAMMVSYRQHSTYLPTRHPSSIL